MKVDSYSWINISWLVWRSVSSRPRDSSETFSVSKLVEHRAQSPVRKEWWQQPRLASRSKSRLHKITSENLTMKVDSYSWINISWLVWRSVSSQPRDPSETFSANKPVEHRAWSPVRQEWWQQPRLASRSKSRLHKITSEKLTMKVDSYLWINISWLVWRSVSPLGQGTLQRPFLLTNSLSIALKLLFGKSEKRPEFRKIVCHIFANDNANFVLCTLITHAVWTN